MYSLQRAEGSARMQYAGWSGVCKAWVDGQIHVTWHTRHLVSELTLAVQPCDLKDPPSPRDSELPQDYRILTNWW